ncbi:MAG: CofH family radical SAM protein [Candidatus Methylacidiphilales bacterium]
MKTDVMQQGSVMEEIVHKIDSDQRLTVDEGVLLFQEFDLQTLGLWAADRRDRRVGRRATYIVNRYLNYSNICILNCQFCSFARKKRDPDAFQFSIEEMVGQARQSLEAGITEIHIVGGLHPTLPFDFYLEMVGRLAALDPEIKIKAFTAIEIRHLAERIHKADIGTTLSELKAAGLAALTGGGAEIFDPVVREQICRGKESAEEWLEVHRIWHGLGGRSTATMLYGHVETVRQRFEHMEMLRTLQDETGGFTGFVPYAFEPENNQLSHIKRVGALEELRVLACARLFLDNFDHITAYWISTGLSLAQVALSYGVDDLHGTIEDERIFHMAGAKTPVKQSVERIRRAISEAGLEPCQRDTYYAPVG